MIADYRQIRTMWFTVLATVVQDYRKDFRKARDAASRAAVIRDAQRYFDSADGREVLSNCGMAFTRTDRARLVDQIARDDSALDRWHPPLRRSADDLDQMKTGTLPGAR